MLGNSRRQTLTMRKITQLGKIVKYKLILTVSWHRLNKRGEMKLKLSNYNRLL